VKITKRLALGLLAIIICGIVGTGISYWHQGYRAYVVHTGSMVPLLQLGDIVIDKPAQHLHKGEVITFRHSATSNVIVTHRIYSIRDGQIRTKGDANPTPDAWSITRAQVRGTVVTSVPLVGYGIVFLKQPAGIGAVMTAALALILLWDLFFAAAQLPTVAPPLDGRKPRRGAHRAKRRTLAATSGLRAEPAASNT
jgi:signal peptidase I